MDKIKMDRKCIWNKRIPGTQLEKFRLMLNHKYNLNLVNYWSLNQWSVENCEVFWEEIWKFFKVISSSAYKKVLVRKSDHLLDVEWFEGALLNYAENMLRIRDERTALICVDEDGNEEFVTYAQMYEEVKVYAAALRKRGLQKGDTVACYMAHRKEAVFAMLAVVSIGALWGGPLPYYGADPMRNIISQMKPKFLFTCDRFRFNGKEVNLLKNVSLVAKDFSRMEVIVVATQNSSKYSPDISNNTNCHFLDEFLDYGKNDNGCVPEMIFEQLPFNHPVFVNFTSGTTGVPKGFVHSAAIILSLVRDFSLHYDMKPGDVVYSAWPVGWGLWNSNISSLFLGATVLLFNEYTLTSMNTHLEYTLSKSFFWDLVSKYKVVFIPMVVADLDKMIKHGSAPGTDCKLEHLKFIGIGGSPVKAEHYEYIQRVTKRDVFVGTLYGCTELMGRYSGFDYNEAAYSGEVQFPSLGLSMECFNSKGHSVLGEQGEIVVTKPYIGFPLYILGDVDNKMMNSLYFSKYPGIWSQNDIACIDPDRKSFVVIARSDDIMNPLGERFTSADIYNAVYAMSELSDYICVPQFSKQNDERAILLVKMANGVEFNETVVRKIKTQIASEFTDEHVPSFVLEVEDIPYNLNNKRMESVVKEILRTNKVPEVPNVRNPECLSSFCNRSELANY